ncbi:hypothetical protein MAPG_11574 [Magnaporthiopsis poae ATCC 64411]|uniref:SCP domain-containing protein n=1 Tax=Magnaporthiopsis poae (strain ATCC 64411 / 73-15) TaxID=644358 RepID=A0A0C4EFM2_MAGP6|nr:hypothetical protein MAPG_11574 [Magnaporthiopsis poae ATCC 64411]
MASAATIPQGYSKRATPAPSDYLSQINGIRAKAKPGLMKLAWDTSLESKALAMAKSCERGGRGGPSPVFMHSLPSSSKGDLLAQVKAAFQETARLEAINAFKAGKSTAGGAELSQLLSDGSTKIGCAVDLDCSGKARIVCVSEKKK